MTMNGGTCCCYNGNSSGCPIHDGAGARKPEVCPSCGATDNNPYTDANGNAMRACGRCMIQWRDNDAVQADDDRSQRYHAQALQFANNMKAHGYSSPEQLIGQSIVCALYAIASELARR